MRKAHRQTISCKQLETWRAAKLLPSNFRRALGRGQGKASWFHPAAVRIAAELGRNSRPGRSLHETVLRAFTTNPYTFTEGRSARHPLTGQPEPFSPEPGVRTALESHLRKPRLTDEIFQRISDGASVDDALADANVELHRFAHESAQLLARRRRSLPASWQGDQKLRDVAAAITQLVADWVNGDGLPSEAVAEDSAMLLRAMGVDRPAGEREQVKSLIIADALKGGLPELDVSAYPKGANERVTALGQRTYREICEVALIVHFVARTIRNRRLSLTLLPGSQLVNRTAVLYATDPWLHQWMTVLEHAIGPQGPANWSGTTTVIAALCCHPCGLEYARRLESLLAYSYGDSSASQVEGQLGESLATKAGET